MNGVLPAHIAPPTVYATVYKCKCKQPDSHEGSVCPKAKVIELGSVNYWPLRHPVFYLSQKLTQLKQSWQQDTNLR